MSSDSKPNWFMRLTRRFDNWVYKRIDAFWERFQKANDNSSLTKWTQNTFRKFHTKYPKYQPLYQVIIWLSPIAISLCLENLWSSTVITESNMNNHLFSVSGLILMVVLYATMFSGYMLYHNRDKTKLSDIKDAIEKLPKKTDLASNEDMINLTKSINDLVNEIRKDRDERNKSESKPDTKPQIMTLNNEVVSVTPNESNQKRT